MTTKRSRLKFVPVIARTNYEDLRWCIIGLDIGAYDWRRSGGHCYLTLFNVLVGFRLDRLWN